MAHNKEPSPEDLSSGAVAKHVLKQTLQHPATILPAAASLVSVFYLLTIDFDVLPFGLAVVTGLVSAGTWVFNYFIRGEKLAADRVAEIRERQRLARQRELRDFEAEFWSPDFPAGRKELTELTASYDKLCSFLNQRKDGESGLNSAQFLALASESYAKGLNFLRAAKEVHKVLCSVDTAILEEEIASLEKQLRKKGLPEADLKLLNAKIESHKRRLKTFEEKAKLRDELLAKSDEQEKLLEISHLELVELSESKSNPLVSEQAGISSLERAISVAKKVEDRLRNVGNTSEEDKIYLRAVSEQRSST